MNKRPNKMRRVFRGRFPTKLGELDGTPCHKFSVDFLDFAGNETKRCSIFINNTDLKHYLDADCGAGINYEDVANKLLTEFVKADKRIYHNLFRFTPATIQRCAQFVKSYYENK